MRIQELRLNPKRTLAQEKEMREWVKANPQMRPETLEAYTPSEKPLDKQRNRLKTEAILVASPRVKKRIIQLP